jgi:alkylhydroperoxidase family enzyme
MRLEPLAPEDLPADVRPLHEAIAGRMAKSLDTFVSRDERGALIGPFPPLLHFPRFGRPAFGFLDSLLAEARLPARVREIAILTVGAAHNAPYELYSHEKMAETVGLDAATIATIAAGQRPGDLTAEEAAAYDMAAALVRPGPVANSTYARALATFGKEGVGELVFLVGGYALICVLLNAFAAPAPEG